MIIKEGDTFDYSLNNGTPATIEVTSTVGDRVAYKHVHGKTGSGRVTDDYFQQLVNNGYFKRKE